MPLLNAIGIVVSDTVRSIPLAKRNRDRVRHVVRAELAERRWNFTLSKPRPVATAVASTLRPSTV